MRQASSLPLTRMVVFLLMLHHQSSARSIQIPSSLNGYQDSFNQGSVSNAHTRQKRGLLTLFSKGLTAASWASYGISIGATVYHAIRHCKDYRPKPCISPTCKYLSPCPDFLCQNAEKNKDYVDKTKEEMKKELNKIDALLLDAFKLELDGKGANINNERILNYIKQINNNVDNLVSGIVKVDGSVSEKFKNKSKEIQAMVQDKRTTVDQIISGPLLQGIFDKWTWDGTGRFVFSLALSIGYAIYVPLKERYAINKIYKEMTADFTKKFENQRAAVNPNSIRQPKLHNKFTYVQGLTTKQIQSQMKSAATAVYKSNQAMKAQGFVSKLIGPIVNGAYTAWSVWSTYKQINKCQKITDDMQNTAINTTLTRDEIEKIKVTEVQPLFNDIFKQTWIPVKDLLVNKTILDLLEGIMNLTVEANFTDTSPANTIKDFLSNIVTTSSTTAVLSLQKKLITALDTIEDQFRCLANKQHAIAILINDCRSGRDTLKVLFNEADSTYDLNTQNCVDKKIVPYTSLEQVQIIISSVAVEKGWYDNCLLNNNDLLYLVCSKKSEGYVKPVDIVAQINKSVLTEEMVSEFLTRCPPPKITPKSKVDTCTFYCLYQTTKQIAQLVGLLESQVNEIIPSCGICSVTDRDKKEICHQYFCKGVAASTIETTRELPLPTVNDVIRNCVQKCKLKDSEKQEVCQKLKCKQYSISTVAKSLVIPPTSIKELKPQCDTIVTKCIISDKDRKLILTLHCIFHKNVNLIQDVVKLPQQDVQSVINSQTCGDYQQYGLPS